MKSINSIEYGLELSPYMGGGEGSIFYRHQYRNHTDFLEALDRAYYEKERGTYSEFAENCPCGTIRIEYREGWAFLFQLDPYGDWDSICFSYGVPYVKNPSDLLRWKERRTS